MTAVQLKAPIVEIEREDAIIDADIKSTFEEASSYLDALAPKGKPDLIETQEEAKHIEEALAKFNSKLKFLDDERKISVTPFNDEVKRINDWYRPALEKLKALNETAKGMLGQWILRQRREAERLAREAEEKAKAALAAQNAQQSAQQAQQAHALMTQSAQATKSVQVQKGAPVSHKPVWKFRIKDAASLPRAFLKPDEDAIKKHVAEHGDTDVPSGVEVYEDVSFRISK